MNPALLPLPTEASDHAGQVDALTGSFALLVVLLSAPVFVLIVYFAVRYRHGTKADRSERVNSNTWLEVSWAVLPFLLILGFYGWATSLFFQLQAPPPEAMQIDVVAKQWMWKFQHPTGQREINELHVPVGTPVRLNMISQDVIHSLYFPDLRIKQDVLPGRYTSEWFTATEPGTYPLRCAEFCGTDHSVMTGSLIAMEPADYADWLRRAGSDTSLAGQGAILFRQVGCSGCHGAGASVHAPSLAGLYGSPVALSDGRTVQADPQYIRDSILQPQRDLAAGYPSIMPTYANILDEGQVQQLVAYVQSLGPDGAAR